MWESISGSDTDELMGFTIPIKQVSSKMRIEDSIKLNGAVVFFTLGENTDQDVLSMGLTSEVRQ